MAFVHVGAVAPRALHTSGFRGRAVADAAAPAPVSAAPARRAPRMLIDDGEVVPAKGSSWKETFLGVDVAGGIPGGEAFFLKWIAGGMKDEFADMPDRLQPTQPKLEKSKPRPTLLQRVDKMEFFKDYEGVGVAVDRKEEVVSGAAAAAKKAGSAAMGAFEKLSSFGKGDRGASAKAADVKLRIGGKGVGNAGIAKASAPSAFAGGGYSTDASEKQALVDRQTMIAAAIAELAEAADPEAPDEALYAPYFPRATRNIAPEISLVCERNFFKDRVSVAMTEVTAKCTDVYFPKERSGKAPFIDIFYTGVKATASISVKLDDVVPLPATAPLVPAGIPTANLVKGSGGGLKLEYIVDGQAVSAYSDPRCIDNFKAMVQ
jgi:hypothetical protein